MENRRADSFTGLDRDGLAVAQRYGNVGLRLVSQGSGVSDVTAFNYRGFISTQRNRGVVDRVGNRSDGRFWIGNQVLEVAARSFGDGGADGGTVVIDVVGWSVKHGRADSFTGLDRDGLAIAQRNGNVCLRFVGQGCGVGDVAALNHGGFISTQRNRGVVDRIGNRSDGRFRISDQVLEVTAFGLRDGGADGGTVVVDVVSRGMENRRADSFTGLDRDGLAVAQRYGNVCLRFVGQSRGVSDVTAFNHGGFIGSQRNCGVVDRVSDGCFSCLRIGDQVLEITAFSFGDSGADRAAVVIDVVGWGVEHS
ncbi:hypothetical protein [Pseudomonas sp. 58 R 3]|nr:hypothetical protein [Pseudomonas sp. 58 R 3]